MTTQLCYNLTLLTEGIIMEGNISTAGLDMITIWIEVGVNVQIVNPILIVQHEKTVYSYLKQLATAA